MSICINYNLQKKVDDKWIKVDPQLPPVTVPGYSGKVDILSFNHYPYWAWLSNVYNKWNIIPISKPRGLPEDYPDFRTVPSLHELYEYEWDEFDVAEYMTGDSFYHSWLSLDEIVNFNYDAFSGVYTDDGQPESYRDWMGQDFIQEFRRFKDLGAERIVFWFY